MEKELWRQIQEGQNIRQNLSKLRQLLKENGNGEAFGVWLEQEEGPVSGAWAECPGDQGTDCAAMYLAGLLDAEDAKTRKNAALLMGECKNPAFGPLLFEAYEKESQRFVKSAYLQALLRFDCREYTETFRQKYRQLSQMDCAPEEKKHRDEELRALSDLLMEQENVQKHVFRGFQESQSIVLMTDPCCAEETARQVEALDPEAKTKLFPGGVLVHSGQIHWRGQVRTWREMLFRIPGMESCPADPKEAAEKTAASGLLHFLETSHRGKAPFRFRIELRSRMDEEKKTAFVRKMAVETERLTERKLMNSVSDYELAIRLAESKKGGFLMFVKLFTVPDGRFSYRKEHTAESIKPVHAAAAAALAKEYLKEDASVLDPFCGVGTMLIERHKAVRANTSYGIDYKEEAIEKAKENTRAAGQIIHYIQKDFFHFSHEYLFDEIFTDMPFALGRKTEDEIRGIYRRFFPEAFRVLKRDGTVIAYTRNRNFVKQYAPASGFSIVKETEFAGKDGAWLMILKKRSGLT